MRGKGLRALLAGIASLAFCGPSAAQPIRIGDEQLSRIRTIGVVSAIGDRFHFVEKGDTPFHDREIPIEVEAWRVDEEAEAVMKRVLEGAGRYRVTRLDVNRAALDAARVQRLGPRLDVPPDSEAVGRILREATAGEKPDVFVILAKRRSVRQLGAASLPGIGLYVARAASAPSIPGEEVRVRREDDPRSMLAPYAAFFVVVVSGETFRPMAAAEGRIPMEGGFLTKFSLPYKRIDPAIYRVRFEDFTEAGRLSVRQALSELLVTSLELTLKQVGFDVQ